MRTFLLIFAFAVLYLLRLPAQGPVSGFMPGGKHTDIAVNYTYEHFDQYYFGNELENAPTTTRSANLFLEHGFSDSLGLILTLPYKWIDQINRGLQDATLLLKYRNHYRQRRNGQSTFITSVGLSSPISAYPVDTENPIGIRATTFQSRILTQFQWNSGVFVLFKTGLDFRLIPSALVAVPALFRVGWGGRKWYVDGWLEFYHTFNPGTDVQISAGNGSRWQRLGATIYYAFTPSTGVVLNAARFLGGANIGKANQLSAGLVFKIDW